MPFVEKPYRSKKKSSKMIDPLKSLPNSADVSVGAKRRKRGSFQKVTAVTLDNGGSIKIPPEALGKRDSISLSTVPPPERHTKFKFTEPFTHLVSEIYQVNETATSLLGGQYTLVMPFASLPQSHYIINVLHRSSVPSASTLEAGPEIGPQDDTPNEDGEIPTSRPSLPKIVSTEGWTITSEGITLQLAKDDNHKVTVTSKSPGWWMVVSTIKEETFTVPYQGILFTSRLSRFVSGRFPKGAIQPVHSERKYRHRIIPLSNEMLLKFQPDMPQLKDVIVLSDVFDIEELPSIDNDYSPETGADFSRAATIRLPLPKIPENLPRKDCIWRIFHRPGPLKGSGWSVYESPSKQVTRTSLAFDARRLGCYIIGLTIENLNPFLGNAVTFLWQQSFVLHNWTCAACGRAEDGVFWLAFNLVKDKEHLDEWYAKKARKGYKPLKTAIMVKEEPKTDKNKVILPSGRIKAGLANRYAAGSQKARNTFDVDPLSIFAGQFLRLTIGGEIRWAENGQMPDILIQTHSFLSDHDVEFRIEPDIVFEVPRQVHGSLKAALVTNDESCEYREFSTFSVDLTREEVKEWWEILHPIPEPPPLPPKAKEMHPVDRIIANSAPGTYPPPLANKVPSQPRGPSAAFVRLTEISQIRHRVEINRESKVISGKSLLCLATEIPDGLVLAITLGLPESMVTGLGFDALSEGLSLAEVTYRILLHWKRRTSRSRDQVAQMVSALNQIGRSDMAQMVLDHSQLNSEITLPCIAEYRESNKNHLSKVETGSTDSQPSDEPSLEAEKMQENPTESSVAHLGPSPKHIVSGSCQARKVTEERSRRAREITQVQNRVKIIELTPPPPPSESDKPKTIPFFRRVEVKSGPKLISIETNGGPPMKPNNRYLSKLAPIVAEEKSDAYVNQNKVELLKQRRNNIENALQKPEGIVRPSTPASSVDSDYDT